MSAGSGNGADVEQRAALWAIRLAESPLEESVQRELDAWLADDCRHLGALVGAQALWTDLDRVVALDRGSRVDPVVDAEPVSRWPRYALAASLVLSVMGGVGYDRLAGSMVTERGEVRRIALEDGSSVFLNSDSEIQVRFTGGERRIVLRRGEASFQVAHNAARPFIVAANDVDVKAVGTEFIVGLDNDDVAVTVADGVVAIGGKGSGSAQPRYLRRNEQFVAASTGPRKTIVEGAEIDRRTAWRRGLLVFRGQQLDAAAAEVNRYSKVQIAIDDPTLARAEFMGVFKVGDARAFANAAAEAFNGEVIEGPDGLRLVRRQNSPSH